MIASDSPPLLPGILVVDDEHEVIQAIIDALKRGGFPVWSALSSQEAIQLYQQHTDEIDLVLLDVQMPALDGPATLNQLRLVRPDLVCYFMCDELGEYDEVTLRQRGAVGVLSKPLDLSALAHMLRDRTVQV